MAVDMFLKLDRQAALEELALVPEAENGWHPSLGLSLKALRSMADYVRGSVDEAGSLTPACRRSRATSAATR